MGTGSVDTEQAKRTAHALHHEMYEGAVFGCFGTDECKINKIVSEQICTQSQWEEVIRQFKFLHPDRNDGDLRKCLVDKLTGPLGDKKLQHFKGALGEHCIDFDTNMGDLFN